MMRDITIGQYYQADSILHRLDPRSKIIFSFFFIISLFMVGRVEQYIVAILFLAGIIKISKVPFSFMVKGLRSIMVLITITFIFNILLTNGDTILLTIWKITITYEGIVIAVRLASRLILIVLSSSLLTLTTTPIQITDAIESLLKPLEILKVPAHEIAMMMTIALRFIPILIEETDKIMKAQMARGADFETGNMMRRAKNLIPLLVPLFLSAFRRADSLALAMEARCYKGGTGRTRMNQLHLKRSDFFAGVMVASYGVVILYII